MKNVLKSKRMNRLWNWFSTKNPSSPLALYARSQPIKTLIERKQIKEFLTLLRSKDDRILCVETFLNCLSTISDEKYMHDLFVLIKQKSRLTPLQLSTIVCKSLVRTILDRKFDQCEQILRLPLPNAPLSLPTYELTKLIHYCPNQEQLFFCLSVLIEKNLAHDSSYIPWVLIIVFEDYTAGDEHVIEFLLKMRPEKEFLHCNYGENNVTPLMLFLHLYTNEKCQFIIDKYLSTLTDQSVLFRQDRWNRSYLTHLLCGQCRHPTTENSLNLSFKSISEWNDVFHTCCPHAASVLSTFNLFYRIGNRCENLFRTILNSGYCLPLQFLLIHYLLENDPFIQIKCDEFFQTFPPQLIRTYSHYLKELVRNKNLDSSLSSILQRPTHLLRTHYDTIEFLLRQGARLNNGIDLTTSIISLLRTSEASIPNLLLNHRIRIDESFDWTGITMSDQLTFYVCRTAFCGYQLTYIKFIDRFKYTETEQKSEIIEKYLKCRKSSTLSRLCYQKIRSSVKHLGDETIEQLNEYIPQHLRSSVLHLRHQEYEKFARIINQT